MVARGGEAEAVQRRWVGEIDLGGLQRAGGFLLIREKGAPRVDTAMAQAQRTDSGPALLVRPDDYIAWAGPDVRTNGPDGWYTAWRAWTGPSAEAVHARR
nr:hypothetical protein [Streptomyces antimycoticus]